ncbi:WSCD family member GA21586-like [Branchiostoma floridae x Branchiostoma belcheri]
MVCGSRWRKRQLFCGLLLGFILFYIFGIGLLIHKAASTSSRKENIPGSVVTSAAGTARENPQHLRYRLGMKAAPAPPAAVVASPARQEQETAKDIRMGAHRDVRLEQCTALRYSATPLPITALVSFPGSGNTWLRYLVQQATGILTGSVYKDLELKRHGFPAEGCINGSVVLVKTHEFGGNNSFKHFDKTILMVRDPYDAILAEFNRHYGGHNGFAARARYKSQAWRDFVEGKSQTWSNTFLDWLKFPGPLLIVQYEKLRDDLDNQLRRITRFLNLPEVSQERMNCVLRNSEGKFKRRRNSEDNFNPFSRQQRAVVNVYKKAVYMLIDQNEKQNR